MMNEEGKNAIAGIAGIVILCALALSMGYDGAIYLTSIGIISGIAGYPVLSLLKEQMKDANKQNC